MYKACSATLIISTKVTITIVAPTPQVAATLPSTTEAAIHMAVTTDAATHIATEEATKTVLTTEVPSLFQLRLTNIKDCPQWVTEVSFTIICHLNVSIIIPQNQGTRISAVTQEVVSEVDSRCDCGFTMSHIEDTSFQCFTGSDSAVTYRAMLQGTPTYSHSQLIDLIAKWIVEDGLVRIQQVLISVDKSCQVGINSFSDPECNSETTGRDGGVDVAVVGGGVSGTVIALTTAVTITVVVIAVLFKSRKNKQAAGKVSK